MTRADVLDGRLTLLCWVIAKERGVAVTMALGVARPHGHSLFLCRLPLLRWEMAMVAHACDPSALEADL